jgi:hypothetical protein
MILSAAITPVRSFLADRINPIVVREARQAVRSKAVFAALWLLLIALVVVTGTFALFSDLTDSASEARGDELFLRMNAVVMVLCVVFVPIYTAWRFAGEHTGAAADLLHTTTVRPSSIVWGKLLVAMMVALLMFSAAAPFLTLTYLFRGIDLLTIAFIVGLDLVVLLVAAQTGVFIAALRISVGLRVIIGLLILPLALWMMASGTLLFGFGYFSVTGMGVDDWIALGMGIGTFLAIGGLMFCLSVAVTAPPTTNRARLPRTYLTILWALSLGLVGVAVDSASRAEAFEVWYVCWCILFACAVLLAGSERRELGPRLLRTVPVSLPRRLFAFLFTSGAAGGLAWAMLMAAGTALAYAAFIAASHSTPATMYTTAPELWRMLAAWAVVPCFALTYTLLAVWVRDSFGRRLSPGTTAPLAMFGAAVCSIVPIVVASTIDPRGWDREYWYYLANPLGAAFSLGDGRQTLLIAGFGIIAALLIALVQMPWFLRQFRAFRHLDTVSDAAAAPQPHGQ